MALILVVDDVKDIVHVSAVLLQILGHEVLEATSGIDAIEIAKVHRFDACLLDLRMPDVSGFEVARFIRRMRGEKPKLVAMSGLAGRDVRVKCLDAGFDYYLLKPFDLRKVNDLIPSLTKPTEVPNFRMPDEEILLR